MYLEHVKDSDVYLITTHAIVACTDKYTQLVVSSSFRRLSSTLFTHPQGKEEQTIVAFIKSLSHPLCLNIIFHSEVPRKMVFRGKIYRKYEAMCAEHVPIKPIRAINLNACVQMGSLKFNEQCQN